jgi:cytochrome c-type biogenesis protein CcmH
MTGFLVIAVLAVLLVLVLLMRPFLWKTPEANVSHRQLNAAIFRDQFARLDADRAENMIREEDYAQARAELQRRVIDEVGQEDSTATLKAPKRTLLAIGIVLPLVAAGFYLLLGSPGALDGKGAPQHSAQQQQEIERMVEGLAKKLESEPDNFKGWVMLARSYKVMGRTVDAERAFARAGSFIDDDAQTLATYADIAATNAGGSFAGKPTQLIEKALKADPDNMMALWLAGTAAFRADDFNKSIKLWERLARQLPPGSDDARTIQESINEAYARLGKTPPAAAQPPTALRDLPAPSAASVSGEVDLAAALKAKVAPDDVVMVIARVPGTRMPVAVLRTRAADLPLKFTLDDSLSMSPQARISMASQVEVEARISKSGMAQPEPGDLVSAVQTVKVGARGLQIHVAKVRP